jgi:hypothetical protein
MASDDPSGVLDRHDEIGNGLDCGCDVIDGFRAR